MKAIVANGSFLTVAFPYDPEVVNAVKRIPGRRFDMDTKQWVVPMTTQSAMLVLRFAADHDFTVDERVVAKLKELAEASPTDPKAIAASGKPVIAPHSKGLAAYFNYDADLVAAVKSVPGRSFDADDKIWILPATPEAAREITRLVKSHGFMVLGGAAETVNTLTQKAEEVAQMSRAENADVEIPAPEGLEYLGYQKAGIQYASMRQNTLIADDMGLGKAQPLDAKVLTPAGWVRMGDIKVGDLVIGSAGFPIRVTGVYPQGQKEVFRVGFSDGSSTECCEEHLWTVMASAQGYQARGPVTKSLKELRAELDRGFSDGVRRFFIPMVQPVRFEGMAPAVDPYRLGVMMVEGAADPIIPESFLYGSLDQRVALLQGLLDVAGDVEEEGVIRFSSQSKPLVEGVREIVMSLGGVGRRSGGVSASGEPRFTVAVTLPEGIQPFRLPSQLERMKASGQSLPSREIESIELFGEKECQCIRVDSPDRLYVTDDYILTHNTIQGIGVANNDESVRSVLVVCPASLKLNWKREWEKWCVKGLTVGVADGKSLPDTDVVVINYDVMKAHEAALRARPWDLLVVDEAHYLKNNKAGRTKQVLGFKDGPAPLQARRKVFLTGTPILNRPEEMWTLIHALAPQTFRSWRDFVTRYCGAYHDGWGYKMGKPENLDELQDKLRSSIMVRRLKKDVLKELPPKVRQVIEVADAKSIKAEQKGLKAIEDKLLDLRVQVELAKASEDEDGYEKAIGKLREAEAGAIQDMVKLRHKTALAKVPFVVDHVTDAIESGKVILFAHHRDVIEEFKRAFDETCVVVTGDTKIEHRQEAVDRFQNDPECKVFIGNIQAAGVGLTLTASSLVVFAELDWTPGLMSQAEDRAHRIGQKSSVLVQHLVLDGSIDAVMAKRLIEKQKSIEQALNLRAGEKAPEFVEGVSAVDMGEVPEVHGAAITAEDLAKQPEETPGSASEIVNKSEPPATARLNRDEVQKAALTITDEQLEAIHRGLKILARVCDGAAAQDALGFNRFDARMGHLLAESNSLTKAQAALGRIMLVKYRRQLDADLMVEMGVEPPKAKEAAPKRSRAKKKVAAVVDASPDLGAAP